VAFVRDQGVCIRQWDWSETSQTVSIFGRETGVIRAVAKGSKRENAKFSGGVEVLTRGEFIASIKGGDAMALLTSWDLVETFPAARSTLRSFHTAHVMLDVINHAVHDSDPHQDLFDALVESLRSIGEAERERRALSWFFWRALVETGHTPEFAHDVRSGAALPAAPAFSFAPRLGGLVLDESGVEGPVWRVRAETVGLIRGLRDAALPADVNGAPAAAGRACRLLAMYFREVFGARMATMPWLLEHLKDG
jgi:DNA repair protein RecO (recombination protein O)